MNDDTNQLVYRVARSRRRLALISATIAEYEAEVRLKYRGDYEFRDTAKHMLSEVEAELRERVVNHYQLSGERPTHPALGIRLMKRYQYDVNLATEWARVWAPALLTLDVANFEKLGPSLGSAPIKVEQVPTATIGTDLSKYLEEQSNE